MSTVGRVHRPAAATGNGKDRSQAYSGRVPISALILGQWGMYQTSREKCLGVTGSVRTPNVSCTGEEALEIDGNSVGRVAIVTGAGQGSGRGVALALAAEGASVAVVGRTESKLVDVAQEITDRGAITIPLLCDVGDAAQIDAVVKATAHHFGRIDILAQAAHHNSRVGNLLDVSDEDIELLWTTGPKATLQFMRQCYPYFRGGGSIIKFRIEYADEAGPLRRLCGNEGGDSFAPACRLD